VESFSDLKHSLKRRLEGYHEIPFALSRESTPGSAFKNGFKSSGEEDLYPSQSFESFASFTAIMAYSYSQSLVL